MQIRGSVLVIVAGVGVAGTADAQDPRDAAREHYTRGLALAIHNEYEAGLQEFKEAYAISPHFAVLYNIGQADIALGRAADAIDALSKYLEDGSNRIPPARREVVKTQIASLIPRLASLLVITDRPGARITIDGRDVGTTPLPDLVRVGAGTHKIVAIAEGATPVTRIISIDEGERQHVRFELPAPSLEGAMAAARAAASAAEEASAAARRAAKAADAAARVAGIEAAKPSPQATAAARKASLQAAHAADMAAVTMLREAAARGRAAPAYGGR